MTEIIELRQTDHVLKRPDMYIGDKETTTGNTVVYSKGSLSEKNITVSNWLVKLLDEAFSNATDNSMRNSSNRTTKIEVSIDSESIEIYNNGKSIPIEQQMSPVDGKMYYIPEIAFGRLNSSSNYDDDKKRTFIGVNGVGIKLVNIFSSLFEVTIINSGRKYYQKFENNMNVIHAPVIGTTKSEDSVRIKFCPDFKRLNIEKIDKETYAVLSKRVYDGCLYPVDITLNKKQIPRMTFEAYVIEYLKMFGLDHSEMVFYSTSSVQIGYLVDRKKRVHSYVNNVCTKENGNHVDNFFKQLREALPESFDNPANVSVLFMNQTVENPTFGSQSKNKLTSKITTNLKGLCKKIVNETKLKEFLDNKSLKTINRKLKVKRPILEKLQDANFASTKSGHECTLFVTEGNSATSMVQSCYDLLGHDYYGIFSLTGKILNVRKATPEDAINNTVVSELLIAIGLEFGKDYTTTNKLRYGKIVCVKDADTDGAAIMGLVLNVFHTYFKSLLHLDFFYEFITPMVQVYDVNGDRNEFYNLAEFRDHIKKTKSKSVKYIKGLASNSERDTRRYFENYADYLIPIIPDDRSDYWMDIAYSGKNGFTDLRKQWVGLCDEDTYLPRVKNEPIEISQFIRYDLILYSYDACERSIPSVYDGLKPTQRKILYTLFSQSNPYNKRKVFQLTAETTKQAQYHHGDQSLNGTIMAMMQTWCGSNTIPLLDHEGFIGSRFGQGLDGGAPRYVSVMLSKIARLIYPKEDDCLLATREEDGIVVEPKFYVPIIPMILINGTKGLGVGYMSNVPLHSPQDCINYIREFLKNKKSDVTQTIGWCYPGFKGTIEHTDKGYTTYGVRSFVNPPVIKTKKGELDAFCKTDRVHDPTLGPLSYNPCFVKITEIPIGVGLNNFTSKLVEYLSKQASVKSKKEPKPKKGDLVGLVDYKDNSSAGNDAVKEKIEYYLKIDNPDPNTAETTLNGIMSNKSILITSSMVLFNKHIQIQKFDTIYEIIKEFIEERYQLYIKRKSNQLAELNESKKQLDNKARFIKEIIDKKFDPRNIKTVDLQKILDERFDTYKGSHGYLVNLPIRVMTHEEYKKLLQQVKAATKEIETVTNTSIEDMWNRDLDKLQEALAN